MNDINNDASKAPKITVKIKSDWRGEYEVEITPNSSVRDLLILSGHEHVLKFIDYKRELYYNLDDTLNKFNISDGAEIKVNQIVYTDGCMGLFVVDTNCESEKRLWVNFPLQEIYKQITNWCEILMGVFYGWIMLSRIFKDESETQIKVVKLEFSHLLENLFLDLNQKNRFQLEEKATEKSLLTGKNVLVYDKFIEMTNREFLKSRIEMLNYNIIDKFCIMPESKAFLFLVGVFLEIHWFFYVSNRYPKLCCFFGCLNICAWASLICFLVFNLPLVVVIPSAIISDSLIITNLCYAYLYNKMRDTIHKIYPGVISKTKKFFGCLNDIQSYLETYDLPNKNSNTVSTNVVAEVNSDEPNSFPVKFESESRD